MLQQSYRCPQIEIIRLRRPNVVCPVVAFKNNYNYDTKRVFDQNYFLLDFYWCILGIYKFTPSQNYSFFTHRELLQEVLINVVSFAKYKDFFDLLSKSYFMLSEKYKTLT